MRVYRLRARSPMTADGSHQLGTSSLGPFSAITVNRFGTGTTAMPKPLRPVLVAGTYFISFERRHRIEVVPLNRAGLGTPLSERKLPKAARGARSILGIEALALLTRGRHAGSLIAISERQLDKSGNHMGWLIGDRFSCSIALKTPQCLQCHGLSGRAQRRCHRAGAPLLARRRSVDANSSYSGR